MPSDIRVRRWKLPIRPLRGKILPHPLAYIVVRIAGVTLEIAHQVSHLVGGVARRENACGLINTEVHGVERQMFKIYGAFKAQLL